MPVSAVVVTYNPDLKILSSLIIDNISQFNKVVVVDNSSRNIELIKSIFSDFNNIDIISLDENVGIAAAQNIGIKSLVNLPEDEIIVFFDQDSSIDFGYLDRLEAEYSLLEGDCSGPIVLGPTFFHRYDHFEYPSIKFTRFGFRKKIYSGRGECAVEVDCLISSGMSLRKRVLELAGLMDELLFIDYVDTEWCLRAISKGIKIFVTPNLMMSHEIGSGHLKLKGFNIPVHPPSRRYYRIRNSLLILKYPYVPKLFCVREFFVSSIHQFLFFIKLRDIEYLKTYFQSVKDAMKKRRN